MKQAILDKISEIDTALSNYESKDISLISGSLGIAIFYAELFELTMNKAHRKKTKKILNDAINTLSEIEITHTLANGFTGVAWGINYLAKKGFVDGNAGDLFEELDPYIYRSGLEDIQIGQYDLLHGAIGPVLFALERLPDKNAEVFLKVFIEQTNTIKHQDEHGFKWEDSFTRKYHPESKDLYSFGLAHGIPSIAMALLKIHQKGIFQIETEELVKGTINWLIHHKSKHPGTQSLYPTFLPSNDKGNSIFASRLAWCYGDLPIALLLLNAGKTFGDQKWVAEADLTMQHSLNRAEALNDANLDGAFCHGTAGIAYLFKKFYHKTANPIYRDRASFWIKETLVQSRFEDGLAGYKCYLPKAEEQWQNDAGLLTGIAGIGLTLIDHLKEEETQWDECLLLR